MIQNVRSVCQSFYRTEGNVKHFYLNTVGRGLTQTNTSSTVLTSTANAPPTGNAPSVESRNVVLGPARE